MAAEPLTREQILDAARRALRRYGPAKTTVVDVAHALGVSHGSVYRHFPTKAALRAAVVEDGLAAIDRRLTAIAAGPGSAMDRLHRWLLALIEFKQDFAREDPELFQTYCMVAEDGPKVASAHSTLMLSQLDAMLAEGVAAGEIRPSALQAGGRAIFQATGRFHNPVHYREWTDPEMAADFERLWGLLRDGLSVD